MGSSFWFDTINHGKVHCTYLGVSGYDCLDKILYFLSEDFFTFTNSVDTDEMQHYAAFHLGSSLFAKVLVKGFPILIQRVNFLLYA